MSGSFDGIIREVLNSTSTHPVGDVVPFPDVPQIMQDDAPIAPDDRVRRFPKIGPLYDNNWHRQYLFPSPANEASIADAILRS